MAPDYLCRQADSLIRTLSGTANASPPVAASSPEVIVNGYAHVLALDVDRLKLGARDRSPRGIRRSAGGWTSFSELSVLLRLVRCTSDQLRAQLSVVRAQAELAA